MLQNFRPDRETDITVLQKLGADCEDASSELMLVDEEQVCTLEQQQSTDSMHANALHGIGINLCRCDMYWANASSMRRQRRQRRSCN